LDEPDAGVRKPEDVDAEGAIEAGTGPYSDTGSVKGREVGSKR